MTMNPAIESEQLYGQECWLTCRYATSVIWLTPLATTIYILPLAFYTRQCPAHCF